MLFRSFHAAHVAGVRGDEVVDRLDDRAEAGGRAERQRGLREREEMLQHPLRRPRVVAEETIEDGVGHIVRGWAAPVTAQAAGLAAGDGVGTAIAGVSPVVKSVEV